MSKCDYIPKIRPALVPFYPLSYTGNYPWKSDPGTIDGVAKADFIPADGYACVTLNIQAVGILPGDTFLWQYSDDGGSTWYDLDAGPTPYGLDKTLSYVALGESSNVDEREPLTEGTYYFKCIVTRPDCGVFEDYYGFILTRTGATIGTVQATGFTLTSTDPITANWATVNGAAKSNTFHYNLSAFESYPLDIDEESLIPDLPTDVTLEVTVECPTLGDIEIVDVETAFDAAFRPFLRHNFQSAYPYTLAMAWINRATSDIHFALEAVTGIDYIGIKFRDVYNRSAEATVVLKLQCTPDVVIDDLCGPCSIVPDWKPQLLAYYSGSEAAGIDIPWDDSGLTINGTPAEDWNPGAGHAAVLLSAQALNLLDGDVVQWEYSPDGITWYDFGAGPSSPDVDGTLPHWSFADSATPAQTLPITVGDWWFGLKVTRDGCDLFQERKKLTLSGTGIVDDYEADTWTLVDGNGYEFCTVNGSHESTECNDPEGFQVLTEYLECDVPCDPTITTNTVVTSGEGGTTKDIVELLAAVKVCTDDAVLCLGMDPAQLAMTE